jgi:hypothetical protein
VSPSVLTLLSKKATAPAEGMALLQDSAKALSRCGRAPEAADIVLLLLDEWKARSMGPDAARMGESTPGAPPLPSHR